MSLARIDNAITVAELCVNLVKALDEASPDDRKTAIVSMGEVMIDYGHPATVRNLAGHLRTMLRSLK